MLCSIIVVLNSSPNTVTSPSHTMLCSSIKQVFPNTSHLLLPYILFHEAANLPSLICFFVRPKAHTSWGGGQLLLHDDV